MDPDKRADLDVFASVSDADSYVILMLKQLQGYRNYKQVSA